MPRHRLGLATMLMAAPLSTAAFASWSAEPANRALAGADPKQDGRARRGRA